MPIVFAKPRLITLNSNAVTDHNRSELQVDYERIETRQRMANGTMRKYFVADKRTFEVSWEMVPNIASQTVDGFWSGSEVENLFLTTTGAITLGLTDRTGTTTTYSVFITDFSKTVVKRWPTYEMWNFSLTMEQV